jgi:hypothetical protein
VLGVVEDGGSDWDGNLPDSAREASGLYLVLALSTGCGVYGGRHKRAVWFRIDYPSARRIPSAAQADASGALPVRIPGVQRLPFSVPLWTPVSRAVMERVRAALVRL